MSTIRCLACLRAATRPTTLHLAVPTLTRPRQLHAFAPTPTLLKKKRGGPVEEDFDEFVEDDIEADLDDISDLASHNPSAAPGLSRGQRHDLLTADLNKVLSYTAFRLRTASPSPRSLRSLFNLTSREAFDEDVELVAKWRSKGLPVPSNALAAFMKRACALNVPEKAVRVLTDKAKYGFELTETGQADIIFLQLARRQVQEAASNDRAETSTALLALERLFLPETDSFGALFTFAALVAHGVKKDAYAPLFQVLSEKGAGSLAKDINTRKLYLIRRSRERLVELKSHLEEGGLEKEADFVAQIISQIKEVPESGPWKKGGSKE